MDLFEGACVGGPLHGQQRESRFPKGALLADKEGGAAWVYDYDPATREFVARSDVGDVLSFEGRMRAANEGTYDVWAMP